jgi:hypothetical protein
MKICILDTNTNKCINILEDDSGWVDHAHFAQSPRNDGEIGWTLLPSGEWDTGIVPPTLEERQAKARARRDKFLVKVVDVINPVRWEGIANKQDWIDYRQALLDVPQQAGFPDDVVWPIQPEL